MTNVEYQYLREDGAKLSAWIVLATAFAIVLGLTFFGLNYASGLVALNDGGRTVGSALSLEDVPHAD
jgi:hypothetical protein